MIANKILIVLVFWWSSRLGYLDEAIRDLETVEEVGLCPPARLHLLLGKLVAKLSLATNLFFFRWSCSAIEGEEQKRARFRLFHLIFGSVVFFTVLAWLTGCTTSRRSHGKDVNAIASRQGVSNAEDLIQFLARPITLFSLLSLPSW